MRKSKAYDFLPEVMIAIFIAATYGFALYNNFKFFGPASGVSIIKMLLPNGFYIAAFAGVLLLSVYSLLKRGPGRFRTFLRHGFLVTRLFLLLTITLYLYLNVKWWSHLMQPGTEDAYLQMLDKQYFRWMITGANTVARLVEMVTHKQQDMYVSVFFLMFVLASVFSSLYGQGRNFALVIYTICLVLFFGGFMYCLMPSYGPFIYKISEYNNYAQIQKIMLQNTQIYKETANYRLVAQSFDSPLGAMPSLHVAHAAAICQAMRIIDRKAVWPFMLITSYLFVYAIVSQFHYVLDLFAGIALAMAIYPLQKHIYRNIH